MKSAISYHVQDGQKIDQDFAKLLNTYTSELRNGKPEWLADIEAEYGVTFPESR